MTTTQLTPKQIANRAYYAKKAEDIKAKKRDQYRLNKKTEVKVYRKPENKPKPCTRKKRSLVKTRTDQEIHEMQVRRFIEDYQDKRKIDQDIFDY